MTLETISGRQVCVRHAGAGQTPALLMHCSLAEAKAFAPLFAALDDKLSMTAFDMPGHGKTEHDPSLDYQGQSVEIAEFLLRQNSEPVHLIGHSYGATVAMCLAVKCPELVASLCIFEPVNFSIFAHTNPTAFAQELRDASAFVDAVTDDDWPDAARAFLKRWGAGAPFDELPLHRQEFVLKTLPMVVAGKDAIYLPERGAKLAAELTKLKMPTLIMEGANSPSAVQHNNAAIHQLMPHATRYIVQNAGHMGMLTHADEVAQAIKKYCLSDVT